MPKKTRYKKILASYRNKLKQEESISPPKSQMSLTKETPDTIVIPDNKDTNTIVRYFKQDFTKSIFLIVGIITLELFFYFVSMSNSLRSVLKFIP
ncbi:hypothetical protein COY87_03085 [Candidatus Roizmanbacteria bacterium CG_4_10_14_0_8_um_filter_33_9]|uniref:Uncharacterized protein n=1 Tax=Candidatus Roizmanbacteria bacterium CG_4_10_14_0_8_um_filter_33_9 TaxID=1974826 RepID=A0A2M7QJK2_9BACT|nr:MAG: hypothetical protein COY87_03085 [Candidatus Roizmanbacteria bacterium CG_4_10_14_0_8_um_filter_33_9]